MFRTRRGGDPKYRRPRLRIERRMPGRKRMDEVTGHWTYEGFLRKDDYGNLTDYRRHRPDRDWQK